MRTADLVFAFPAIILAMVVTAALGRGLTNAVLALVIVAWPSYARVVRSLVLSVGDAEYVWATRLLGSSARRALVREVLPNVVGPVLVLATLDVGNAILLLSGLSFLGLGAQPPAAEWGSMVATGTQYFQFWWMGTFPGLAIFTAVLAFNFIGDSLRDVFDPRPRASRGSGCDPGPRGRPALCPAADARQAATVVDGIDYRVEAGEVFGIAGESGSGKTMSVLALMGLLPQGAAVEGRAVFEGQDLLRLPPGQLRRICGRDLAMVFQDPMTSLHPMLSIGTQLTEHVRLHLGLGRGRSRAGRRGPAGGTDPGSRARSGPSRTSSPEGCDNGSPSLSHSRAGRSSSSPTSRRPRSTSRSSRDHPTARPPSEGVGVDDRPHHARPRRPLVDRGPGRGLLRRSRGGGGEPDRGAGPPPTPVHARAPGRVAPPGSGGDTAHRDPWRATHAASHFPRLRVPSALPARASCREAIPPLVPVNGRALACPVDPLRPAGPR